MLKAGIAGFGFMGQMHFRCLKALEGVRVAAVCDSDPDIAAKAGTTKGNIEGRQRDVSFSEFELYRDFDSMLENEDLDVVSITLPTYLHKLFTIKALNAGLHVFCEKPMALNSNECAEMISAAQKSGRELMIGHCIRFWPQYSKAKEIIDSGKYGGVISAVFHRLASAPDWGDCWFKNEKLSGGMAMDLHIHDTDFIQYLFGIPQSVLSAAASDKNGLMVHISTLYNYGDNKLVTADGSWAMTPSFGFKMSFNIAMERAVMVYDSTFERPLMLYPLEGDPFSPLAADGDGYQWELDYFIRKVKGCDIQEITSAEQSALSVRIVEAELESARTGKNVNI
jgi:1,5-anhydro-D-fructose reductase (1,5-anhydro-D-mannitol-forming)